MVSKLWTGGGDEIVHSKVPTFQGLFGAFFPDASERKKFTTKKIWKKARLKAHNDVNTDSASKWDKKVYY